MERLELEVGALVAGGDGLARLPDGRVVFVHGAAPDERVVAEIVDRRRDFAKARVVEVLRASAGRTEPPCAEVARGCGGCGWQHLDHPTQRAAKRALVAEALRRGAHLDVDVQPGPTLAGTAHRTTVRVGVAGGRAGFRRRQGHELVAVARCLVAHPSIDELIAGCRFSGADEVTLRVGARTGDRLIVLDPDGSVDGAPAGTVVVTGVELDGGREASFDEVAAGRRWRISARSFFQTRPDGADALVAEVRRSAGTALDGSSRVADLYGGVGLFAGALATDDAEWTLVESSASSVADARHNLVDRPVRVVASRVEAWRARPCGLVIADPPRAGLGRDGVAVVAATGAERLVLVSCDAAALGRDAKLLAAEGFVLTEATLVDLFPQTSHVEVVSRFDRPGAAA